MILGIGGMPTEIAFKAIDWALENSGAKLAITFYGGEPLLNFKLMKAVIERSQAKRGNKEIVYSFTSNMSLMTREIATYLAQVPNLYGRKSRSAQLLKRCSD